MAVAMVLGSVACLLVTALAPWRPPAGPAARPEVARRYLADMRRRLHRDPFPLVTARHDVDQALAATDRGRA